MKKDTKVFEIKAIAANGNNRTVLAMAPLNKTLEEVIKMKNIPMLSIRSTKVSAPMTYKDATDYIYRRNVAAIFNPNEIWIKTTISVVAA